MEGLESHELHMRNGQIIRPSDKDCDIEEQILWNDGNLTKDGERYIDRYVLKQR